MIHDIKNIFAKTKILCTLGPATSTKSEIKKLMEAGVDGVRLNFSHGDYKFFENLFLEINQACVEEHAPLAVLLDLQGPKIRIGELAEPEIEINNGDKIEITTEKIPGTKEKVSTSYLPLPKDAQVGDIILIDDGLIKLKITGKSEASVFCVVENGGKLKPKKGMNLPGMKLSTASVTEKDLRDLEFALQHRVDFIALSFVRREKDITGLRDWLKERGHSIPIIAKIEKPEAVENFEEILKVADGIMVARGDLGVEMEAHEVPIVQKNIIRRCNEVGKMVITATQMLESMISNPIPTRAEASDVANAVWDGTDVVMLSGETSVGKYPVRAAEIMNNIIKNAERNLQSRQEVRYEIPDALSENLFDSFSSAICQMSRQVNAKAIVVFTSKGRTAISLSKFRPAARIIALSDSFETMNHLCLKWGVTSVFFKDIAHGTEGVDEAKKLILQSENVKEGDLVIFTAGAPYSEKSRVNWLKFETL